jgi:riboflavin biosynthesis pyrimidine reductase
MGSREDRCLLEKVRAKTDAGLIGAGTLRSEDPEMRIQGLVPEKRIRSLITFSGGIPLKGKKFFESVPRPVVFASEDMHEHLADRLKNRASVMVLPSGPGGLSIQAAVDTLELLGADSALIEGGGRLNYEALRENVVDEIYLTLTPFLSGDKRETCLADGPEALGNPFLPLELLDCERSESGELFLRYRVTKEQYDG